MPTYNYPRRGEVWIASLDPTIGHEIKKTRPVLVVSDNIYNEENWVVLVLPFSSSSLAEYDQVAVVPPEGGLQNDSVTLPDQLRAVDRKRLASRLGELAPESMLRVDRSLRTVLGL